MTKKTKVNGKIDKSYSRKIIAQIKSMKWDKWLERSGAAFTLSNISNALSEHNFKKIGIPGIKFDYALFQGGSLYYNQGVFDKVDVVIGNYLKKKSLTDITTSLAKFKKKSEKTITDLIKSDESIEKKFSIVLNILSVTFSYIWLSHSIESYFKKQLKQDVPKYIKGDVDKFIGDASFPKKKNSNAILSELIRSKLSSEEVAKRAGWVKLRDIFDTPFTSQEIDAMRKNLAKEKPSVIVKIPAKLQKLFKEIQELVFFRTERTDVRYYLCFLARPILKEMAKKHKIPFKDMMYYRAESFLTNKPERYSSTCSFAYAKGKTLFQNEPIIEVKGIIGNEKITGAIAFKGKAKGIVKIVKNTSELDKVKNGDVLVAQMTFPAFISAMNKAAAFVTDEGGITCHAAIVARELKKPCIIGTKIATQVLKDGDLVEVDANNGVVKILKSK